MLRNLAMACGISGITFIHTSRWYRVSRRMSIPRNCAFKFLKRHLRALQGKENDKRSESSAVYFRYLHTERQFDKGERTWHATHAGARLRKARRAVSTHQVPARVWQEPRPYVCSYR